MKCNRFMSAIMLGVGLTLSLSCTKAFAQENLDSENQVVETQESQVSTYSETEKDGWQQDNGYWYYYEYGSYLSDTVRELEDTQGVKGLYYFDSLGHMVTDQWIEVYDTFYFGANGKAYTGKQTVNGKTYLFHQDYANLLTYYTGIINNTYYETNENGVITYESSVDSTGWVQIHEKWGLVEDGQLVYGQWRQINNVWYYFDWSGLTTTGFNQIHDEQTGNDYYYYFDDNGHMMTNYWYNDDYSTYYFGSNGRAYTGKHQIDGINYLFYEHGPLATYYSGVMNSTYYETDENGVITNEVTLKPGWNPVGNSWMYLNNDGTYKHGEWYQENNIYYYFNWNGLTAHGFNEIYDEKTDNYYYYYFDDNGHMMTNYWYNDDYSTYYFGSNGRAYTGKHQIDGKNYLFYDYGALATYYTGVINSTYYETDENGIITYELNIQGKGWQPVKDRWTYIEDDGSYKQNEWYKENGIWYYFDWNGLTLQGLNEIYDEKTDSYYYYYFDNNGHMLTNQWINDNYDYYYVGSNGRAYTGKHQINNQYYLFGQYYPSLNINASNVIDGVYYETNENGVITTETVLKPGWNSIKNRWLYMNNDKSYKQNEWYKENGIWYYFDWSGLTLNGLEYIYDENSDNGNYYYFDNNGHMLTNQWIYNNYDYYYVGSNGHAYTGKHQINNQYYLFNTSYPQLLVDYEGVIEQVYYKTNYNGIITFEKTLNTPGWIKVMNRWFYVNNDGTYKHDEWYKENGVWYYFDSDGLTLIGLNSVYDEQNDYYNHYYFDNNGHMLTNYWLWGTGYGEPCWMYFDNSGKAVTGAQYINNKYYYFSEEGYSIPNKSFVTNNVYYVTNKNGEIVNTKTLELNKWQNVGNEWYFISANGIPYNGLKTINGITYYFYDNGQMATGREYIEDSYYAFDSNGHMIKNSWWQELYSGINTWYYFGSDGKAVDGWLTLNNSTYYLSNGRMYTGLQTIDNQQYLFNQNGQLITDHVFQNGWNLINGNYYYSYNNQLLYGWKKINNVWYYFDEVSGYMLQSTVGYTDTGAYYFASNGQYIKNKWQKYYYDYVYAGADGKLIEDSWKFINGKWYYFEGYNMVNQNMMIDNEYHLFADNGQWLGQSSLSGWIYDYGWKYYINDDFLADCWQLINGKYYYFDEYGYALQSGAYIIDNELFYFYDNCAMASTSGWVGTPYGSYVYLNSNHRVMTGWQKINNIWYYLDNYMCRGIHYIEGQYHQFAQNGAWLGTVSVSNGWYKLENDYYYFENGKLVTNQFIKSGNNYYYLTYYGQMATGLDESNYFDNTGKLLTNQWIKVDNKWMYVDINGKILTQATAEIDGVKYNFDEFGYMI